MDYSEKFDRAVRSVTGFLAGYVRQDSLALLQDESIPNTGIVVFKKDGPGRIAIYTDVTDEFAKPKAALLPGELLGYQTAHFLVAAGIPHDRKADHGSKEWKLFMAGFNLAARLAGRMPAAPAPKSQPAALDVLRGMICWTEDEEGALCQCVRTADQVTNPDGVFVRLSTLRAALAVPVPAAQEQETK